MKQQDNSSQKLEADRFRQGQKDALKKKIGAMDDGNPQYQELKNKIDEYDLTINGQSPEALKEYQGLLNDINKANRSIMTKRLVNLGRGLVSMGSALGNGIGSVVRFLVGGEGRKKTYDLDAKGLAEDKNNDPEAESNETTWKQDAEKRKEETQQKSNRWDQKIEHKNGPGSEAESNETTWKQDAEKRKEETQQKSNRWDRKIEHSSKRGEGYVSSKQMPKRTRSARLAEKSPSSGDPSSNAGASRRNSTP